MDRIDVDLSELREWERELEALPRGFMTKVEKVVSRGALNIKRDWARAWEGHPSIRHLPRAINYDLDRTGHTVRSEIGPAMDRTQGTIAPFIEFGNVEYGNLRNAPIPGGQPALDAEQEKFVRALADLGEKAPVDRGPR
jgi:hypothetical protein